jgi:hypothetical protein
MSKSFHIKNERHAQQIDEANNMLWLSVKAALCLIVLVSIFKSPDKSADSALSIELPAISLPTFVSHPNENNGQFAKYPNGDPVCGGEFWCYLGWKL